MTRLLTILLLFMFAAGCASYKQGNVEFQFRDATTKQYITNANVDVDAANFPWIFTGKFRRTSFDSAGASTDGSGIIRFDDITLGGWLLRVDAEGYDLHQMDIHLDDPSTIIWHQSWSTMLIMRHHPMAPNKRVEFRILKVESPK